MNADRISRRSRKYLIYALGLLSVIEALAAMDRSIFSVLMPAIKRELVLSDTELGLLSGLAFTLFYGFFGLPIGLLADRYARGKVLALSLFLWSVTTAASGAARSGAELFLARMGAGVGEAGSLPPAHALLSGYFAPARRPVIFALHTIGGMLGVMLGLILGGILADRVGWRMTYVLVGLPGVAVAIVAWLTLREPAPVGTVDQSLASTETSGVLGLIVQRPAYRHVVLALAGGAIGTYGFAQWTPSFYVRTFGLSLSTTGVLSGVVTGVSAIVGLLLGGIAGAVVLKRWGAKAMARCLAAEYLLAAFGYAAMFSSRGLSSALAFQTLAVFFNLATLPPAFALIQGVSPARVRARAAAVMTLTINIIGGGLAPLVIGFASDHLASLLGTEALRRVLVIASCFMLWPVMHMLWTSRTVVSDLMREETKGGGSPATDRTVIIGRASGTR